MSVEQDRSAESAGEGRGLLALAAVSLVAGAAAGLLGTAFRVSLQQADRLRGALIGWAHGHSVAGFLLVAAVCATATVVAAWLVRRHSPEASGSGIPQVEAELTEQFPRTSLRLIPVKFVGGLLAIGSGLALGREGPSVQMGASVSQLLAKALRLNRADCRAMLAAGAGAGLATAFNAPIAGAVFVLEELVRRFDARITVATFGASAGAIAIVRTLLGGAPDYLVEPLPYPAFGALPVYLALGILAGLLGAAYNQAILGALDAADGLRRWPVELRAAFVGAAVGILAWFAPDLVGGGDALTQAALAGSATLSVLPFVLMLRFGLGAVSYASHTPGGLFAPLLVLGAQGGVLVGIVCGRCFPALAPNPTAFAVVGMAAFFTAVVRAPLTGIILVTEMTGSFTQLLPMLGACFAAMIVPTLLRNAPIYDSLRERALRGQ